MTQTIRHIANLRDSVWRWRSKGRSVAMVPTMGALHAGHLALVEAASKRADRVIVTIFVNPAQFAEGEDLDRYPRTEDDDLEKLRPFDPDIVFAPPASEIYPDGFDATVTVGGPSAGLETDARPHFFAGIATVVTKLLLAGLPDFATFGEKDYQQLLVVKKLVRDLNIPTAIIACPTVREADGLALSSRNAYLSADERAAAPKLFENLGKIAAQIGAGAAIDGALARAANDLERAGFEIDYLVVRNAGTLQPVSDPASEPMRALAAARLGATRLIDNVAVPRKQQRVSDV
jgi:pantoate--beta-alanine ligase